MGRSSAAPAGTEAIRLSRPPEADPPNPSRSTFSPSFAANQVFVNRPDVLVCRRNHFHVDVVLENDPVELPVELPRISGADMQPPPVLVDFDFDDGIHIESMRGDERWPVAPDQNLDRMIFHFSANVPDSTFSDDVSIAQHDDPIRDHIHFMEHVTRND